MENTTAYPGNFSLEEDCDEDYNISSCLEECTGNTSFCLEECSSNCSSSCISKHQFQFQQTKIYVMSLITVVTIVSNLLIVIAVLSTKRKISRMNYFILHLSLADISTALFTLCPEIIWSLTLPYFYGGFLTCKLMKSLQMLGPYLSSYILCATAMDRRQVICTPFVNLSWSPSRSKKLLIVAYTTAFLFCTPQAYIFNVTQRSLCESGELFEMCWADFTGVITSEAYVLFYTAANFCFPLIVLSHSYSAICLALWRNDGPHAVPKTIVLFEKENVETLSYSGHRFRWVTIKDSGNARTETESPRSETTAFQPEVIRKPSVIQTLFSWKQIDREGERMSVSSERQNSVEKLVQVVSNTTTCISRAKVKTVKLTTAVIACYIISSLPFIIGQLVAVYGPTDTASSIAVHLETLLYLLTLNSVTNPWIYIIFNDSIFSSMKSLFARIICRKYEEETNCNLSC
ncbi:isotocin receptor [Eurytemora carolleeae]|uniref:isotocin receptor n=1 Tax=Eurytemora carolleeae TaxID=1294199 RepID=UPI000C785391|nr:isotocin receptor [Eurytemora carolleeae]|eukprot:XP_023327968.1 isotocin receptor-like [Eurytemora affinis]